MAEVGADAAHASASYARADHFGGCGIHVERLLFESDSRGFAVSDPDEWRH